MNGWKKLLPTLLVLGVVGAVAIQLKTISHLRSEVADMRSRLTSGVSVEQVSDAPAQPRTSRNTLDDPNAGRRLADLENAVKELTRVSEHLKRQGQVPPGESEIATALSSFLNAAQPDRDRLRALRVLRRTGPLSDDIASQAIAWLQSATNAATQRGLLQELEGVTNGVLKQPLLALTASADSNVREEAIANLRRFISDPQVETALWNSFRTDPDEDVRQRAERTLERGPFSQARLASLQEHALNPQSPLDERLLVLRALTRAKSDPAPVTAALAQLAQTTTDSDAKLKLIDTFDGMKDPVLKLPLVTALQDANPNVREKALDALAGFQSDPKVKEWLQHMAQNDADPEVRRAAFDALEKK